MWPGVDRVEYNNPEEQKDQEETKDKEESKTSQKKKQKKINKAYDQLKNDVAVVFYKQSIIDDQGNTYQQEIPLAIGRRVSEDPSPLSPPDQIQNLTKGVAVEIVHCFLDELWNAGSQQLNISSECRKILVRNADGTKPAKAKTPLQDEVINEVPTTEATDNSDPKADVDHDKQNILEEDKELTNQEEKLNSEVSNDQNLSTLTEAEMDAIIIKNFLMLIIRHVKDSDLPLEPSKLQSDYMYRYEHNEHGKIDFKRSSFKKISKFLKKMKQQKYITFDKIKGVDHEIILKINREFLAKEQPDISGFHKIEVKEEKKEEVEEVKGAPSKEYPVVEITEVFKLNSNELAAIFEDCKVEKSTYYTIDQCRDVISQYITNHELDHPKKRNNAFLDEHLIRLVKDANDIKVDNKTGKSITNKGSLFKDIEIFLRPFHVITKINVVAKDAEKIKPGYIPKIKVVIEKFNNKNVTRVIGLETWEIDFKDACTVFKNKLAVGVSISEPEKSFSSEHIKIQGIHPEKVENIIVEDFKILRKYIDQISNMKGKTNKGKKK